AVLRELAETRFAAPPPPAIAHRDRTPVKTRGPSQVSQWVARGLGAPVPSRPGRTDLDAESLAHGATGLHEHVTLEIDRRGSGLAGRSRQLRGNRLDQGGLMGDRSLDFQPSGLPLLFLDSRDEIEHGPMKFV